MPKLTDVLKLFVALSAALAIAWGAIEYLAPWARATDVIALRKDLVLVGGVSYSTALSEQQRYIVWLMQQLKEATGRNDQAAIQALTVQLRQAEDDLKQMQQERSRFR